MKRAKQQDSEILERFLGRLGDPVSPGEAESAANRVLQRLRADGTLFSSDDSGVSSPALGTKRYWMPWAAAVALLVIAVMSISTIRYFGSKTSIHAVVETVGDGLFLDNGSQAQPLQPGKRVEVGEQIRSNGGAGAVVALVDGSRIEMRSKSALSLQRGDDGVRIRLAAGSIIVTAAKQRGGHLYVDTKDCTVSVIGTVFMVEASDAGSRVTVIQGEVQVQQNGTSRRLLPGDQATTAPMEPVPLIQDFRWSRYWSAYWTSLQQAGVLPSPPPKFATASLIPDVAAGDSTTENRALVCRGIDGTQPAFPTSNVQAPRGGCMGRRVTLVQIVAYAYNIPVQRVAAGPDGVQQSTTEAAGAAAPSEFRLEAVSSDPANTTTAQLRQMLQTLLADQFKLRFHSETRELPGYVLFAAQSGLKLPEATEKEDPVQTREGRRFILRGKTSMPDLTDFISKHVLAHGDGNLVPVVNKTGLPGVYKYVLQWSASDANDAALRRALEEQLGLRLESLKVPQEVLVIDGVEKPSGN